MGNQQSTKKGIFIGTSCFVSILGIWYLRSKSKRRKSQKLALESLQDFPDKEDTLFKKNKEYSLKLGAIQNIATKIKSKKEKMSLDEVKEMISHIDLLVHEHVNPIIVSLEHKSRTNRRKKIKNLNSYINEVLENLETCESATFMYLAEVLKDAGLSEDFYLEINQRIVHEDPGFLNHLGAVNEKRRIMRSPAPQKYIFVKDAILFFEKKLSTLDRIKNDVLFKSKIDLNMSQIGIILQNYISDLVVLETKVEEFDILRRSDLMINSQIQNLQKQFLERFLFFTQQIKSSAS
jgi:hypothetical protein